jgi:hypothetical protein
MREAVITYETAANFYQTTGRNNPEDSHQLGDTVPRILDLGTGWGFGQLQIPAALPLGKEPRYPLNVRLGGPQRRSVHGSKKKDEICLYIA